MNLLLETIGVDANGEIPLAPYHYRRFVRSCIDGSDVPEFEVFMNALAEAISESPTVAAPLTCRLLYSRNAIIRQIQVLPRKYRQILRVGVVEMPNIQYNLKAADRRIFTKIHADYSGFDEIIITRNGMLTDGTFTNIYVQNPEGANTPALTPQIPLLFGCMREKLLADGFLKESPLHIDQLEKSWRIGFINALNPPGNLGHISVSHIQKL